jgi:type I restriction-modification system DNA methylase subunit
VKREKTESYLTSKHIEAISKAYLSYENVEGLCKTATLSEIECKEYSLAIQLYVGMHEKTEECEAMVGDCISTWILASENLHKSYKNLASFLSKEDM